MARLAGKIALITGAGSGFGEGMARRFAAEGARVAVVDLRVDQAARVAESLGDAAIAIEADVSSGAAVEAASWASKSAAARPARSGPVCSAVWLAEP